ncbi:adenylate/guanylate cyclase domain-containing protein [Hoeflea sp. TYP-13]|uniref:AAA family ATPase n=1 Tax=Hoeflea sp. TYP-13 TaxID=3230023 RepID=UPI0034C69AF3
MQNQNDAVAKHCIECGHRFAVPSPFCERCGAQAPVTCLQCGHVNSHSSQFCGTCGAKVTKNPGQPFPTPNQLPLQQIPARGGDLLTERKLVTIMVVDMIGSLAAIQDSDPEEAHAFISFAISLMKDAIHMYSGTVMSTTGDGVLAVFGAPIAQADHAARSCHAALLLSERIKNARKLHPMLNVRIGLFSGEVVLGTWTNDFSIDYDATGATVHIASRLQSAAPDGCAVMGLSTKELIGSEFETRSMGQINVRGLDEKIEIFVLDGLRASDRGTAPIEEPFVGRSIELDNLKSAHESAMESRGQVVLISGEAGIGKTRLINQFVAAMPGEFRVARVNNGRHQSGAAFHGFRTILLDLMGALNAETDERRSQISQFVDNAASDAEIKSALLELFDISEPKSDWHSLNPYIQHELVNKAILKCLTYASTRQPLVLIFEDVHNADSCSVELLGKAIESIEDQRVLVLITGRPEFQTGWATTSNFKTIRLTGLTQTEADELIEHVVSNDSPTRVLARIKEWAQGNPLFLRECIRMMDDAVADVEPSPNRIALVKAQPPASIWAIIAERIDLLEAGAKEILLAASVLGERFSGDVLTRILERPEAEVITQLEYLKRLEFVSHDNIGEVASYSFCHPLFQEVCYSTLLKRHRVRLHAAAFTAFVAALPAGRAPPHEALAHHAFNGMKWREAIVHCRAAGEKAAQHSAPREAAIHFSNALHALNRLDTAEINAAESIDIRISLRSVLVQVLKLHEAEELLSAAGEIAEEIDDKARLAGIVGLMAVHEYLQRGPSGAEKMARKSISLAKSAKDNRALVSASICLAQSYYALGKFAKTIEVIKKTIPKISPADGPAPAGLLVHPMLMCRYWLAVSKAELGEFSDAESLAREMLAGQSSTTVFDTMYAKTALGFVLLTKGESASAFKVTAEALEIADAHDLPYLTPVLASQMGLLLAQRGDSTEALRFGRRAVNTSMEIGVFAGRSRWCARLAEIALMAGEIDESRKNMAVAISVAENANELSYLCSALKARAQLATRIDSDFITARDDLTRAIDIARNLHLKPAFAKCLLELAYIDQMTGNGVGARRKFANASRRFENCGMHSWARRADNEMDGLNEGTLSP